MTQSIHRAVLSRGGKALDLTDDHKPNAPKEMERIYRYHILGIINRRGREIFGRCRFTEVTVFVLLFCCCVDTINSFVCVFVPFKSSTSNSFFGAPMTPLCWKVYF